MSFNINKGFIVGAYATAPSLEGGNEELEKQYYKMLTSTLDDMHGLEIPFWGKSIHQFGDEFLLNLIHSEWDNILTCVPATVYALKENPNFGLASDDDAGRILALKMHKRANKILHKINKYCDRDAVIAVHLATAPKIPVDGVNSSVDSFSKSLKEIMSWDWMGADIVVEHCDSFSGKYPVEKGFMPISDEIEVLSSFMDKSNKVGLVINWARSAIEGRSPKTVIEHIKCANKQNLLRGLMFSGTSVDDIKYGKWADLHMPFAKSYNIENYEVNSLLTEENITNTINAINKNDLKYMGIKLLSQPIIDSTIDRRVGINRDALFVLKKILIKHEWYN